MITVWAEIDDGFDPWDRTYPHDPDTADTITASVVADYAFVYARRWLSDGVHNLKICVQFEG